MKKIYLSGPLKGNHKISKDLFLESQQKVKSLFPTSTVVIPTDLFDGVDVEALDLREDVKIELREILECNALVLLTGWEMSESCILFRRVAQTAGLAVKYFDKFINEYSLTPAE